MHENSSFRVEDVILLVIRKIDSDSLCTRAQVYSGFYSGIGISVLEEDIPDENISPKLWKKLIAIDAKLNSIMEKLILNTEGFNQAQYRKVSFSEEDICILTSDIFTAGDFTEIKMLLPLSPQVWIILYGKVTQVRHVSSGENEIMILFSEMSDDVKQVMGFYLMNRQREIVRKLRSSS